MKRLNRMSIYRAIIVVSQAMLLGTSVVVAQEEKSAAEIAAELSNPAAAVASLSSNFNFTEYDGSLPDADNQRGWNYLFQPSIPFPQDNGKNLLLRPAIPLLMKQPVFNSDTGTWSDKGALGDVSFDLAYGGTNPETGLLTLYGLVGTIPTATDDAVGSDQWQLGPEFAIGVVKPWGVVGGLITHKWDVGGDTRTKTNITSGQYFYAFPFGDGTWQIAAGPSWSYNHELVGEKWTLPVGIGLSKTTRIGSMTWKFAFQYWNYVKTPDAFGEKSVLRFTVTPVISVPWAN